MALDADEAGVTVKFQGQAFTVVRYCVRKCVDPATNSNMDTAPNSNMEMNVWPPLMSGREVTTVSRPWSHDDSRNVASAPAPSEWG